MLGCGPRHEDETHEATRVHHASRRCSGYTPLAARAQQPAKLPNLDSSARSPNQHGRSTLLHAVAGTRRIDGRTITSNIAGPTDTRTASPNLRGIRPIQGRSHRDRGKRGSPRRSRRHRLFRSSSPSPSTRLAAASSTACRGRRNVTGLSLQGPILPANDLNCCVKLFPAAVAWRSWSTLAMSQLKPNWLKFSLPQPARLRYRPF